MSDSVLVTGGAGFIGQNLCRDLLEQGFEVKILDNFSSQVHESDTLPNDLSKHIQVFNGDIRNKAILRKALKDVNKLVHFAAETGTGQSMYQIEHYFDVNVQGTSTLLDILSNESDYSISDIIVASSRSIYGEGLYECSIHGTVSPNQRDEEDMKECDFDVKCPICSGKVSLIKTSESSELKPFSYYGLTKQIQEQMILMYARNKNINGYALRYQNVYGPGQSLKNPYTGILAIFSNLARQNTDIEIYEDGLESRDFVYIQDVINATLSCITSEKKFVGALNIGSGKATTVLDVAKNIKSFFSSKSEIIVSNQFRVGDIRHNIADISKINKLLDFIPETSFAEGLNSFLSWVESQPITDKHAYSSSVNELKKRGLMR